MQYKALVPVCCCHMIVLKLRLFVRLRYRVDYYRLLMEELLY